MTLLIKSADAHDLPKLTPDEKPYLGPLLVTRQQAPPALYTTKPDAVK
jgi:hypothetical protein